MPIELEMSLRVLTYHRVAEARATPHLNPRMISATPEVFDRHMSFLSKNYHVLNLPEVLRALEQRTPLPRRAVLVTFDDAYLDFGEIAWPILKKYRVPATLFVPTGYPGRAERSFWWDRLYRAFNHIQQKEISVAPLGRLACANNAGHRNSLKRAQNFVKTLPHAEAMHWIENFCAEFDGCLLPPASVLSWEELRRLAREGVTLGAHTVNHPMMTRLTQEEMRYEIAQAQKDLQREIGSALPIFCYPSGGHDDGVVSLLRAEGIRVAFTTLDGHNDLTTADPLRLRRTNVTPRTTTLLLRLRLMRLMSKVDAWRHGGE